MQVSNHAIKDQKPNTSAQKCSKAKKKTTQNEIFSPKKYAERGIGLPHP